MARTTQLPPRRRNHPRRTAFASTAGGILFFAALSASGTAQASELRVTIDGIRSDRGKVRVALHKPVPDVKFPDASGTVAAQWRTAGPGALEFVFADLPPGRFAVAVFHDENDNDELDVNLIGIPKEGYAFSRDARGFAGPPSFDAAAVEISEGDGPLSTTATLGY